MNETGFTSEEFLNTVNAFRLSRVILTAFELEIFTHLKDSTKTSAEIASETGISIKGADRLMNALVPAGLLKKDGGKFSNTEFSKEFLVKGSPKYMSGINHTINLWDSWTTLTSAVKEGTTVLRKRPISERDRCWIKSFIEAMHYKGKPHSKEIVPLVDLSEIKTILDVGGGSGAYSFEFLRKKPDLKVYIFDLPEVTALTQKYIDCEGFTGKVFTISGNYLENDFGGPYDMIFLSAIIHSNSPDENKTLLKKCYNSINKGGKAVISDYIMCEDRTSPIPGTIFAINMLVGTKGGDTYTKDEVFGWLDETGFTNHKIIETSNGNSLIISFT